MMVIKKIIYPARRSLLFYERDTRIKKNELIEVTMGTYDDGEVCKLVGIFFLDKIVEKCDKSNIALYCDEGLSVYKIKRGTQLEKIKKSLQKTFKNFGLSIVAESDLTIANYLGMTLDLNDGSFKPYLKSDDIIEYY